jgi:hypothetical protein
MLMTPDASDDKIRPKLDWCFWRTGRGRVDKCTARALDLSNKSVLLQCLV